MKKFIIIYFLIFTTLIIGQEDNSRSQLNLLLPPISPGFTILGIEPSSIERPGNPSDFAFSILHSTNNFSELPRNYSFDLLPFWIFGGQNITYQDFISNEIGQNIKQSFNVSIGLASPQGDSSGNTSLGIGLKISILRGEISDYQKCLHRSRDSLNNLINLNFAESYMQRINTDSILIRLEGLLRDPSLNEDLRKLVLMEIDIKTSGIREEVEFELRQNSESQINELKNLASEIKFKRYGFKIDLATGMGLNFPAGNFDYSKIDRVGAWLTGGYDGENNLSLLAAARLFFKPDLLYYDTNNNLSSHDDFSFDVGVKIIIDDIYRFSLSGELLYQSILNHNEINGSYKYDLSIFYSLTNDYILSFTFGKDFENNIRKGGNLIAAINLLMGFGSERPI